MSVWIQVGNDDLEDVGENISGNKFKGIHVTIKYLADKLNASAAALSKLLPSRKSEIAQV